MNTNREIEEITEEMISSVSFYLGRFYSEELSYFDLEDIYELSKKIYDDFGCKIQYNYLGEYFEAGEMLAMVYDEIKAKASEEFYLETGCTNLKTVMLEKQN